MTEFNWILLASIWNISAGSLLVPFGQSVGDQEHRKVDDACEIQYQHDITVFGARFSTVFICTNGLVSLDRPMTSYTPTPFPLSTHTPVIAAFWSDIRVRSKGNVFARQVTSRTVVNQMSQAVEHTFNTSFNAAWMLAVTYDNVPAFGSNGTKRNTFQLILLTSANETYAVYNYKQLTWHSSSRVPAQVGFDAGDGVNFYALPGSRTPKILSVQYSSNVGVRGRWMFRLSDRQIKIPSSPPSTTSEISTTTSETSTTTSETSTTTSETSTTTQSMKGKTLDKRSPLGEINKQTRDDKKLLEILLPSLLAGLALLLLIIGMIMRMKKRSANNNAVQNLPRDQDTGIELSPKA